jgi:hypothetical protein
MQNNTTTPQTKSPEYGFEELYSKKEFKKAADYLLQNKGYFDSGIFHYNLGTTYAKLEEFGAARFHLEKAQSLGFYNSALNNNLQFIKTRIVAEDLSNSDSFYDQFIDSSLALPGTLYYTMTLVLIVLALTIFRFAKNAAKIWAFSFLFLSLIPLAYFNLYLNNIHTAVVLKDASILEGPSKIFQEKGKIKAGAKIILGDQKEEWFFIKYPISLTGWVSKNDLGFY